MRLLFIVMFILYGFIISTISYSISNYYQTQNTKTKLLSTQIESFNIKSADLRADIEHFNNQISALKSSKVFKRYLDKKIKDENVIDVFSVIMNDNQFISQLRFIDAQGDEQIRFDRKRVGEEALFIGNELLQNKAQRYYFLDIKKRANNEIWYSKVDLNVEHGKIQEPIVPTLRIGTPIYTNTRFDGIIIMNIFFKDIIDNFVDSPFFYISIYDKDGEFIFNKINEGSKIIDYSWSRYLKKDYNLEKHLKKVLLDESVNDYVYERSIYKILPNADSLTVRYEPKLMKFKQVEENENNYILTVTVIVLVLSIPLAFIISFIPNILNKELYETKKMLEREAKAVDEYVYLSVTDKHGIIIDVSQAYCDMTGYTKDEIIGQTHSILNYGDTKKEKYRELWDTILNNKVWEGELKNIKKSGEIFYVYILITPNLDEKGDIKYFTAYMQDITYQKRIEKISITDELTHLYNRREFYRVFRKNIATSKRYQHPFALMMLDVDYFKQYNDTYGHLLGDKALLKVASKIEHHSQRETDTAFRIGGEEFALIFSATSKEEAYNFAMKIKESIESLKIEHIKSEVSVHLTVSIGFIFKDKLGDETEDELYQACDNALYKAKELGRNQVASVDI